MSMNEKLREEREFDCETSIGSQKLAAFPKGESKRLHQRQKLKIETIRYNPLWNRRSLPEGESKKTAYLTIALRNYGKQVSYAS